jgi:enoyl-CoA hydratase
MADYLNLLYQKQRSGVLITLNRPNLLNAMNKQLKSELREALAAAKLDEEIRAVVITGAGEAFSVGDDLGEEGGAPMAWPYSIPEGSSLGHEYDRARDAARHEILECQIERWEYPKPLIAAVSGWCLGSGAALALTCHLSIAADNAVFGQPQVRHGDGTDFIWTVLANFKNALSYGLTGDSINAAEALRLRLVNKVLPREQLLDESFRLVERIALVPPETVKINLQKTTLGWEMMGLGKAWSLNAELTAMARVAKREKFARPLEEARNRGGVRAFIEARDGPFRTNAHGARSKEPR